VSVRQLIWTPFSDAAETSSHPFFFPSFLVTKKTVVFITPPSSVGPVFPVSLQSEELFFLFFFLPRKHHRAAASSR